MPVGMASQAYGLLLLMRYLTDAQAVPLDVCAVYAGSPHETNFKWSFLLLALLNVLDDQDWRG